MLSVNLNYIGLLILFTHSLYSASINFAKFRSRKIKDGEYVGKSVRYMVYLVKAEQSKTLYDHWICGGAIVSKEFIVTSAACVEDVEYMYAISGYSRYVNGKDIDKDECTRASKKKIVFICVPKSYEFAYDKIEKWANIDIAAVKVESPYDFSAPVIRGCFWTPNKIDINYDATYQGLNRDSMVLGWGHASKWRSPDDPTDYNQDLQYTPIRIMSKIRCKKHYNNTPELLPIIDKYMICAWSEGNLDDAGETIRWYPTRTTDGCARKTGGKCQEPSEMYEEKSNGEGEYVIPYQKPGTETRNLPKTENENKELENDIPVTTNTYNDHTERPTISDDDIAFEDILNGRRSGNNKIRIFNHTRKAGICQNDHGGPLVTWVGMRERLIGVASVFRLNKTLACIGPYLFTSTQCNGGFLNCIINGADNLHDERKDFSNTSPDDALDNIDNPDTSPDDAKKNTDNPDTSPDDAKKNTDNPDTSLDNAKKNTDNPDSSPDDAQKNTDNPDTSPDDEKKNTDYTNTSPDDAKKNTDDTDTSPDDAKKNTDNPDTIPDDAKKNTDDTNTSPDDAKKNTDDTDTSPDNAKDNQQDPDTHPDDAHADANNPDTSLDDTKNNTDNLDTNTSPDDSQANADNPDSNPDDKNDNRNNPHTSEDDAQANEDNLRRSLDYAQENKNNSNASPPDAHTKKGSSDTSKDVQPRGTLKIRRDQIFIDDELLKCGRSIGKYELRCGDGKSTLYESGRFVITIKQQNNNMQNVLRRSAFCDLPPRQKGFDVVERHVSWKNHPDGPADNEVDYTFKRSTG